METPLQNHLFWDKVSAFVVSEMATKLIPGLSLAVLRSGKLLFARGYGLANLELAAKADEQTVYGLASVSKTFAATALMLLVADDRCGLNDSIRTYLPEAPANWEEITLRYLLAHASGLPSQVRFEQYGLCEKFLNRLDVTRDEFLRAALQMPLDFQPGTQTKYGSRLGCASYYARFLDAQVSIILLANRRYAPVWDLGKAIAERFLLSEVSA